VGLTRGGAQWEEKKKKGRELQVGPGKFKLNFENSKSIQTRFDPNKTFPGLKN
jgi:hypothetical protein